MNRIDEIAKFIAEGGGPELEEPIRRLVTMVVDECLDVIAGCDPSPKMIIHEPYRTIRNKISDHFHDNEIKEAGE